MIKMWVLVHRQHNRDEDIEHFVLSDVREVTRKKKPLVHLWTLVSFVLKFL